MKEKEGEGRGNTPPSATPWVNINTKNRSFVCVNEEEETCPYLNPGHSLSNNSGPRGYCEEGEEWVATPTQSQPWVNIGEINRSYHRVEEGEGWSTTRLQLWVNTSVNRDTGHHPTRQQQETRDFCLKEGEEWNATPPPPATVYKIPARIWSGEDRNSTLHRQQQFKRDFCVKESEGWRTTRLQPWVNINMKNR